MKWLRHAFALDPAGPAEPTESQRAVVERLCRELVRRRLDGVALMALESCRPLNYLGAQALHVIAPLASVLFSARALGELAAFLERRGSIDYLCTCIEALRHEPAAGTEAQRAPEGPASRDAAPQPTCPHPAPDDPSATPPRS